MAFNGDLLLEIFSHLYAKLVLKYSSSCKAVRDYLSEDFFLWKQANNMLTVGDTDLLIEPLWNPGWKNERLESHPIDHGCSRGFSYSLPPDSIDFVVNETRIIASSNGLLCCQKLDDAGQTLVLFNPTTKSCSLPITVPAEEPMSTNRHITILFACEKDDYLLMTVVYPEWTGPYNFKIYSPEQNIWRDCARFDAGGRNLNWENCIYLNGVVYVISDSGEYFSGGPWFWPYIMACNMNGKFRSRFLAIPEEAKTEVHESKLRIFRWGSPSGAECNKSICLVKLLRNMFAIWVLLSDNNGNGKDEWAQILEINMNNKFMGISMIEEFTLVNGSSLLFVARNKVYRYDLRNQLGLVEQVCNHECGDKVSLIPFSSTLRPTVP